jgi:hypothetical protein
MFGWPVSRLEIVSLQGAPCWLFSPWLDGIEVVAAGSAAHAAVRR